MRRILSILAMALVAVMALAAPAPAIVGGTDAATNVDTVSIWTQSPHRNRCSGTVIGERTVLTAAHCIYSLTAPGAGTVELRIGSVDNRSGYTVVHPASYHWPADFDPYTLRSDIMVIKTQETIPASVATPARYDIGSAPTGTQGQIAGYGWVCDGPDGLPCSTWYAGPLQRMTAQVLPDSACAPGALADPARQSCFGSGPGSTAMACLGDSGTTMRTKGVSGQSYARILVVADGDPDWGHCGPGSNGPGLGMGTDVAAYRTWIDGVITDSPLQVSAPAAPARMYDLAG